MGVGGWVESRIRLISAEAEAEALLGLAELGNKLVDIHIDLPNFNILCCSILQMLYVCHKVDFKSYKRDKNGSW